MSYKNQKDVLLHIGKSKYVQIYTEVIEFLNRHFNSKQFSQPSVIFDDKHHKDAAVTFFFLRKKIQPDGGRKPGNKH